MKIFKTIRETQAFAMSIKLSGGKVAVVPTMGYLHDGHMSLVEIAKKHASCVIVTIFVNPTQFGPNEDLDKYPRDFENDSRLCEKHGVDAIFAPSPAEMYFPDFSTWVNEENLSKGLCGKSRPIHFRGVTTVVTKLFNATLPDVAVFGQKDAQQLAILKRMTRDLNFPVEIIPGPIVREDDGLAMSSRNKYLSTDERLHALSISRSLFQAQKDAADKKALSQIMANVRREIENAGGRVDYIEAVDAENLETVTEIMRPVLLAVAIYFGSTRLIDNVILQAD